MIGKGVWCDGKKYETELGKNARLRTIGGNQSCSNGSPPSGTGGNRTMGAGYRQPGPWDSRPVHGLSHVCPNNYRGFGHYLRTCTIGNRIASGYIGDRGKKQIGAPGEPIGNVPQRLRMGKAENKF